MPTVQVASTTRPDASSATTPVSAGTFVVVPAPHARSTPRKIMPEPETTRPLLGRNVSAAVARRANRRGADAIRGIQHGKEPSTMLRAQPLETATLPLVAPPGTCLRSAAGSAGTDRPRSHAAGRAPSSRLS